MQRPDRYFYIIETFNNSKYVHFEGNIYPTGEPDTYELDEWTGICLLLDDIISFDNFDFLYNFLSDEVKYANTLNSNTADKYYEHYFNGKTCTRLDLKDLDPNTPCGFYYFDK